MADLDLSFGILPSGWATRVKVRHGQRCRENRHLNCSWF
jgi:hypothetical protein